MRISDWSSDVCSSDLQHRRSESDDLAATPEIEARPDEQPCDDGQPDRARPEHRDRRIDERPHAIARERAAQRGARARERREQVDDRLAPEIERSEEHTSELQSLMRISYAVFCLNKKTHQHS